ncbi:MAG: hypothetical protein NWE97_03100 [Candidatus Bathyarchaeota archaeon]|nr:hypothetical protein [Candidatus Bathyarchaeota archaeon]
MAERETIEKVKEKQGILSKIQNFLTMGYGTKEDLRELDKKLRDLYYVSLRDLRHVWEDVYLGVLDGGVKVSSRDLKKVLQTFDTVMEKVNRSDYGYSGLMDRKGHIREEELSRVFNYDKKLGDQIDSLKEAVIKIQSNVEGENWLDISTDVKKVKGMLLGFEDKWREREKEFRPLEI